MEKIEGDSHQQCGANTNTYFLVIDGRLPGLNDYQLECRRHKFLGAKMKRENIETVTEFIKDQFRGIKITGACEFVYRWYEPNRKRDKDNISSYGRKVIQDALVDSGVLKNDGWNEIISFRDYFEVDKENPRVVVEIIEHLD